MLQRGWQVVWALLAVGGCAGELREPGRFAFVLNDDGGLRADTGVPAPVPDAGQQPKPIPALPECATTLLQARCGMGAACHGAGAAQVDLVSSGVAERLVGMPSSSAAGAQCKDRVLVADDGSDSLLLQKLVAPPPCGSLMPIVGAPLDDTERACFSNWVDSLADGD